MNSSLIKNSSGVRVSSVLNKNVKEFGKQYMTDDCGDTCWNSDQGSPQWLQVDFPKCVKIEELHLQFQGGFAGKECWVETKKNDEMKKLHSIYPEDKNSTDTMKVVFQSSTDFFGRIIVYKLDVKGHI
ncbi:hypothetical protein JTE90_022452 [Oedothorax gibbosus]|uniref:F5/8 type C domain-containing protein n=1 Tax=Oedothorax gibbosus TaxID=931172 RepID=A0AAV6TW38_9ARAC|nr:hypothetical protein JTE90_022452 [Oedothorax gibbosus]